MKTSPNRRMRLIVRLLSLAMPMLAAIPASAQRFDLPGPSGYINDFAGVIGDAYADSIQAVIDDVREKSGGEIVVVTLQSLQGRSASEVALQIGREWKIGKAGGPTDRDRNTGVVVLLAMAEHDWRIETGTVTTTFIPAAEAGRIGREQMVPELRAGNVGRALFVAVDSLGEAYARHFGFTLDPAYPPEPVAEAPAPATGINDPVVAPTRYVTPADRLREAKFWFFLVAFIVAWIFGPKKWGWFPAWMLYDGTRGRYDRDDRGGPFGGGGFGGDGWGGGGFGGGGGGGGGGFGGFGGGGGFSGGGAGGKW